MTHHQLKEIKEKAEQTIRAVDHKNESIHLSVGRIYEDQRHILSLIERVQTLEAEIKVLVDGAGKDRAEIEKLKNKNKTEYTAAMIAKSDLSERFYIAHQETKRLREELKLSEARRAELVLALRPYSELRDQRISLNPSTPGLISARQWWPSTDSRSGHWDDKAQLIITDGWGIAYKALASQSRPKILDVLEAAEKFAEQGYMARSVHGDGEFGAKLRAALAAMEKEG